MRVDLVRILTRILFGETFHLIVTAIIKTLQLALQIVFKRTRTILILFWHVYRAVNVMEELIYGAILVQLVSKVKLGMQIDAAIINS